MRPALTPQRLVLAGWLLLSLTWLVASPPFAGPDEDSHYLRALEVGRGNFITELRPELASGDTERQLAWNRHFVYEVRVPAGLAPHQQACWTSDERLDAGCLDDFRPPQQATTTTTQSGGYQPVAYVLPGVATRAADAPGPADRLARALHALLCLAFLYIALRMAWSPDAGPVSLLGLMVAVTPMVIFCASVLNPSGLEIAAAIAFATSALRLRRDESCARSFNVWAALGAAGAVLAFSRPTGPVFLVLIAVAVVSLGGFAPAWRFLRGRAPVAIGALLAVVAAVVGNRWWEAAHAPDADTGFANLRAVLDEAAGEWWRASSELIGKFGYLEYRLPPWVYAGWFAAGFVLVALALRASGRRDRIAFAAVVGAAALLPMLLWVYAIRQTGFGLQGRYVLPVMVVVPLIAGELIRAHAAALGDGLRRALTTWVPPLVGALQLAAFYWAARRAAVGTDGPLLFLGDAGWSPPLGWVPWLVAAAAGGALLAFSPRAGTRRPAR